VIAIELAIGAGVLTIVGTLLYLGWRSRRIPKLTRDDGLEEAARVCDALAELYQREDIGFDVGYKLGAQRCAEEIRARKNRPVEELDA